MNKRAVRQEYKLKKTPRGIFAVRCEPAGRVWVGASTHLDSEKNGLWFSLRTGSHRNQAMQDAWDAHGEESFVYEIVETLDDDIAPLLLRDTLAERQTHWRQTLAAHPSDPLRG